MPRLASPEAFRVWLYRIARAQAARAQRAAIVDRERLVPLDEHDVPADEGTDGETAETAAEVHHALAQLHASHREVLTLHYLQDLTLEEMAAALDRPVGTMKSRLFEARRALRRVLKDTRHE